MSISWYLFEIAINIFQGWTYSFFLCKQLKTNRQRSKFSTCFCRLGMIFSVALFYSLYLFIDLPVSDIVIFGITFAFSLFMFSDPWYIKLIWNIVTGGVLVATSNLISQIFIHAAGTSWPMLMEASTLRIGFVLCGNMVLIAIYYLISQFNTPKEKLSWYALALFTFLNLVILLALEMQYNLSWQPNIQQNSILVTIFCLILLGAGLLILFELLSLKAEKQAKLETEIETNHIIETHLTEVRSIYQHMLEYEHDMKNQINTLRQMIDQGNIVESKAYLDDLRHVVLPVRFMTGCIAVDALLTAKTAHMNQLQIELCFTPYPLNEIPVAAPVLCTIIGNLLDNAIEAIQRIPQKNKRYIIELSFTRIRDMFFIRCKNETGKVEITRYRDGYLSSKRKNQMGHGISSICRSVDRLGGEAYFGVENGVFIAEITIPFSGGANDA